MEGYQIIILKNKKLSEGFFQSVLSNFQGNMSLVHRKLLKTVVKHEIGVKFYQVPFHYPLMLFFSEPIDLIYSVNKNSNNHCCIVVVGKSFSILLNSVCWSNDTIEN